MSRYSRKRFAQEDSLLSKEVGDVMKVFKQVDKEDSTLDGKSTLNQNKKILNMAQQGIKKSKQVLKNSYRNG